MNATEFVVFLVFFALVTVLGFVAAKWQRGDLNTLHEWGLAGRRFGTFISWFLIGGDLYTAYTFIAVPALVFGAGALGFFAVPYTVVIYPLLFAILPRLWAVSQRHGYITASDFVQGRWSSHWLALAVAFTGIVATMPYIALQLVGMQVVLQAMGLVGTGIMKDLPLIIAFAILALYTYTSGLRAPALVAVVKDLMIYITVIVALIVIPTSLGGFGHIFQLVRAAKPTALLLSPKLFTAYGTLAFGSAVALFFYPHAVTGILSARSQQVIRRNSVLLPLYSLLLGFIALLGFMAIAAGLKLSSPNLAVPALLTRTFSPWFVGFGFAAIVIGALVPAAIMSIAAANMFTRNIYKVYFRPDASPAAEASTAKLVSLFVKLGALIFVVAIPISFSLYLQTLGGIWILQTVPTLIGGLYTRWFHRTALFWGWAAGMVLGTWMVATGGFKTSFFALHLGGSSILGYAGVWALIVNLVIVLILSPILHGAGVSNGRDETAAEDYVDAEGGAQSAAV